MAVHVDSGPARALAERLSGNVLVGGNICSALAGETIAVVDPATRDVIGRVPRCGQADVDRAVQAAHTALPGWSATAARARGALLYSAISQLEANFEDLACLQSLETGHAIAALSRGDIRAGIEMLKFFAGLAGELKGKTVPDRQGILHYTTCDPIGVVGAIIPWNGPVFTLAAKLGPALVAGNTIVVKTSEEAPFSVLYAAELMQSVLPAGVLNIISGLGVEAGKPLAEHALVDKVTFTGSARVGQQIMSYVAPRLCEASLELGGSNPNIVMADADLDLAIPGIVHGMRYNRQGQSCIAGSRIFIHDSVYDQVVPELIRRLDAMKVGHPFDESSDIGALISQRQYDRVVSYLDLAEQTPGARVLCGGRIEEGADLSGGLYLRPTLIEGVDNKHRLCQEEIFGPVSLLIRWHDYDEMIAAANDTVYGLVATLWTRDLAAAVEFVSKIRAGLVQVNNYNGPGPNVAYGGLKMSGIGKEYSLESMLHHYTSSKTVMIGAGSRAPV